MIATLLGLALTPLTAPLSYGMTLALSVVPSLDVNRTTDPIVANLRATAL